MRVVRILVLLIVIGAAGLAVALMVAPDRVQGLRYQRLTQAAWEGSTVGVQTMLWLGADPDGGDYNATVPLEFVSPLGAAATRGNVDVVLLLLENGANIDAADPTGFTPLVHAASQGHVETVRVLLAAGASTDAVSMSGTAREVAESAGHVEVARLLTAAEEERAP